MSDGFVEELESRISSDGYERGEEEDSESVRDQISGAHHGEIGTDGSGWD